MGLIKHFEDVPMDEDEPRDQPVSDASSSPAISASASSESVPEAGTKIAFDRNSIPADDTADSTPPPSAGESGDGRRRRGCGFWFWFFFILAVVLGAAFWIRYCNPYITDAKVRGYVVNVERRGIIFKTFEGELLRKSALDDTTSIYSRDFNFTIENDSVARLLQEYAGTRQLVELTYRSYYGTLPWRGASRNVVEAVEKEW